MTFFSRLYVLDLCYSILNCPILVYLFVHYSVVTFLYLYTLLNTNKSKFKWLDFTAEIIQTLHATRTSNSLTFFQGIYHVGHLLNTTQNNLQKEKFFVVYFKFYFRT